ncbi:MAG: hypothetical protein IKY33_02620 [Clostridia bacterium]|nr:hypothetical protein [Clostridia bacterium]
MLRKLLKYDLRDAFNKVILIYATLTLLLSVATKLFGLIENSAVWELVTSISFGFAVSGIFGLIINVIIHTWVNLANGFYGDRSYLTHTLPVTKGTLYTSKFFAAALNLVIGIAVSAAALLIMLGTKENFEFLKSMLLPLADMYDTSVAWLISVLLLEVFMQMFSLIQVGNIGIILGHRCNGAKVAMSFLFGGCMYVLTTLIVLGAAFLCALFNENIMQLFISNEMANMDSLKALIYLCLGVYAALIVIEYFVAKYLLKKGVNVD